MFSLKRSISVAFVVPFTVLTQKKNERDNVLVLELVPLTCEKHFKSPPKKDLVCLLGVLFKISNKNLI